MSEAEDILKEEELIIKFKETGSLDLLGELYRPYMHLVYGLCLKYLKEPSDAQDAVMSIFEELIDKLNKHEVTHFKSWLYVVSKNYCLMLIRKRSKQTFSGWDEQTEIFMEKEYTMHPIDESIYGEDQTARLNKCIAQLKSEQKRCVELFYLKKKSYQEIANETSLDIKKVKSSIQNGKRNLKICMESSG